MLFSSFFNSCGRRELVHFNYATFPSAPLFRRRITRLSQKISSRLQTRLLQNSWLSVVLFSSRLFFPSPDVVFFASCRLFPYISSSPLYVAFLHHLFYRHASAIGVELPNYLGSLSYSQFHFLFWFLSDIFLRCLLASCAFFWPR